MKQDDATERKAIRKAVRDAAAAGFPFYVYTLADADGIFYVGKGKGYRVLMHGRFANDTNARKLLRIATGRVSRSIVAFFTDQHAAYAHEGALIAEHRQTLTNIAGVNPVDPRAEASLLAAEMLARLAPPEEWRVPASFHFPFAGCRDVHELHARAVQALQQEIEAPMPTEIVCRSGRQVQFAWSRL